MRGFRDLPSDRGLPPDLPGPLCPPAPGPGGRRHLLQRWPGAVPPQGPGLRGGCVHRGRPGRPAGRCRHRAHPLLHHRWQRGLRRPPLSHPWALRPGGPLPQRQPDQHRGPAGPPHRRRPHLHQPLGQRGAAGPHQPRPGRHPGRGCGGGPPRGSRRLLAAHPLRRCPHRRPGSPGLPAPGHGCHEWHHCLQLRDLRLRPGGCHLPAGRGARRDGGGGPHGRWGALPVPAPSGPAQALRVRAHLLRPARFAGLRPERHGGPPRDGPPPGPASSRGSGSGGAGA